MIFYVEQCRRCDQSLVNRHHAIGDRSLVASGLMRRVRDNAVLVCRTGVDSGRLGHAHVIWKTNMLIHKIQLYNFFIDVVPTSCIHP